VLASRRRDAAATVAGGAPGHGQTCRDSRPRRSGGLILTIGADLGWTWLIAVAALVTAQIVLIAAGWRVAKQAPLRS
jgi:hypothetical protein